ncbi:uncharacterized protein LOC144577783 [Callithrix jacchus]
MILRCETLVALIQESAVALVKSDQEGTIQDGRSPTSQDCSSQGRRRELEDATLSDKFWSLTEQKIPQWRKHMGGQRYSHGRRSGSAGTSVWQLSEQSKQVQRTRTGPQQDTRARRSGCDGTSAQQRSAQSKRGLVPLLTEVWSPGKAESPTTVTRRKPDRRILGRKAPSVLTPLLWPWELTTWTSTQET